MKIKLILMIFIIFPLYAETKTCHSLKVKNSKFLEKAINLSCDVLPKIEEEVDCSVLRNYRDENGNFTCPAEKLSTLLGGAVLPKIT